MKVWLILANQPVDRLIEWAREAEDLGYEGVSLPDHLTVNTGGVTPHPTGYQIEPDTPFADPLCAFAAMASVTTRLQFLTYIYIVPLRDPFALAKQIATLELLSDNRFVLGTGVGWLREEFETIGQGWSTRGRRLDEMLDIMRDIWDDGYAEYHGQYFDFPTTAVFPVPSRQPEIWIGGSSQAAAERAARFDGYMPLDSLSERSRAEFAMIHKVRSDQGLSGNFERLVLGPTVPDIGDLRRLQEKDGVTGIAMSPLLMWNESMAPRTHEELLEITRRYAESVIGQV